MNYNDNGRRTKIVVPVILMIVALLVISMFLFIYFKKDKKENLLSLDIPNVVYAGNEVEFLPIGNKKDDTVYEFISDNNEVAQFEYGTLSSNDSSNTIIAKKNGKAKVKVIATSNGTEITVCSSFDNSMFSNSDYKVSVGKTTYLNVDLSKYKECYDNLTYTSTNNDVATVSKEGIVTALKEGITTIEVSNGTKTISTNVEVVSSSDTVLVTDVKVDKTSISLEEGKTSEIKVDVLPSNATNKSVDWKSSNEKVAVVSSKGVVEAIGVGNAVITVTTQDGNKSANVNVTVTKKVNDLDSVCKSALEKGSLKKSYTLTFLQAINVKYFNDSLVNDLVTWSSSDPTIVKVDRKGNVLAIGTGKAYVNVSCNNKVYERIEINAIKRDSVKANKITLRPSSLTINVGVTKSISATVTPKNASIKNLKWVSSDNTIAKVNNKGQVTGVKAGKTKISVSTADGSATANMNVVVKSSGSTTKPSTSVGVKTINVYPRSMNLSVGSTGYIDAVVLPENASNNKILYSSSNTKVATVNKYGTVKAVGAGTAVIKVSSDADSRLYKKVTVRVKGSSTGSSASSNKSISCTTIFKDSNNKKITNTNSINTSKISIEIECIGRNTNIANVLFKTDTSAMDSSSVREDRISTKKFMKYGVINNKNNSKKGNHILTVTATDTSGVSYRFTSSITIVGDGTTKTPSTPSTNPSTRPGSSTSTSSCPKINRVNSTTNRGSITFNAYITKEAKSVSVKVTNLTKGTTFTKKMTSKGSSSGLYYYSYTLSTVKNNKYVWSVIVEDGSCHSQSNTYTRTSK
jgi:uncharacterized protein YjdB